MALNKKSHHSNSFLVSLFILPIFPIFKNQNLIIMIYTKLANLNLNDPFFDSLKADYKEFPEWFDKKSKAGEYGFVTVEKGLIQGFLYLKIEDEQVNDVTPTLPKCKRIKVGTFKINPHGTRLGERYLKKIFDYAIINEAKEIYVTIFPKHQALKQLFEKYGFEIVGKKNTNNGSEEVFVKSMINNIGDVISDYPIVLSKGVSKYLLSIYPEYHSRLFPDSLLNNENYDIIKDVSHTNSIHKIYICYMDVSALKAGDLIVIYRTSDGNGPAYYRSVATSVCVVEALKQKSDFANLADYLSYCKDYSVFDEKELTDFYNQKRKHFFVIKMTYNVAFAKRVNRKVLLEQAGLDPNAYWGFMQLSDKQFEDILKLGQVSESIIIN